MINRITLDETSWVEHVTGRLPGPDADELLAKLTANAAWEQRERRMINRVATEPRLTAEYNDLADAPDPAPLQCCRTFRMRKRAFRALWGWRSSRCRRDARGDVMTVADDAGVVTVSVAAGFRGWLCPGGAAGSASRGGRESGGEAGQAQQRLEAAGRAAVPGDRGPGARGGQGQGIAQH
jgi:hypothetical protein